MFLFSLSVTLILQHFTNKLKFHRSRKLTCELSIVASLTNPGKQSYSMQRSIFMSLFCKNVIILQNSGLSLFVFMLQFLSQGWIQKIQKDGAENIFGENAASLHTQHMNILGVIAQYHSKDDYLQNNSKNSEKKAGWGGGGRPPRLSS